MLCEAINPCNPHVFFMPLVEAFASVHTAVGGGFLGITIIQFGLWMVLYVAFVNAIALLVRDAAARWIAGIASYLMTGLLTLALSFYAITPAMNVVGIAYLTAVWPFWIYANIGVPAWLAPFMFTF